jgi:hypothetical protein
MDSSFFIYLAKDDAPEYFFPLNEKKDTEFEIFSIIILSDSLILKRKAQARYFQKKTHLVVGHIPSLSLFQTKNRMTAEKTSFKKWKDDLDKLLHTNLGERFWKCMKRCPFVRLFLSDETIHAATCEDQNLSEVPTFTENGDVICSSCFQSVNIFWTNQFVGPNTKAYLKNDLIWNTLWSSNDSYVSWIPEEVLVEVELLILDFNIKTWNDLLLYDPSKSLNYLYYFNLLK